MPGKPNFVVEQRLAQGTWFSANLASHSGYRGANYRVAKAVEGILPHAYSIVRDL